MFCCVPSGLEDNMMTKNQTLAFVDDSKHALEHLFSALNEYNSILDDAQKSVEKIQESKKLLSDLFMYRDQWSPNANHYYIQYIERMKGLNHQENLAKEDVGVILESALVNIGATVESMSSLAGAVLQISKQVLSLRHAGKPNISNIKTIGSQSILEVIWEGRNHALHWDEGVPKVRVQNMLDSLSSDLGITIEIGKNNCLSILGVLGWKSADDVIADLKLLVQ